MCTIIIRTLINEIRIRYRRNITQKDNGLQRRTTKKIEIRQR